MDILPDSLKSAIKDLLEVTQDNSELYINLCVAYCPEEEIFIAAKKSTNKNDLFSNLSISEPVDILIRTGFSNSISNFLPLQNGYSRIYFINKLINDVDTTDIQEILDDFDATERRFGL